MNLPDNIDVEAIAEDAIQAAFKVIADRLASYGYPVTGDIAPDEAVRLNQEFRGYVRSMATNNPILSAYAEADSEREQAAVDLGYSSAPDTAPCEVCGDEVLEGQRYVRGPLAGRIFCDEHDPAGQDPFSGIAFTFSPPVLCSCEVEDDGDGETGPHLALVEIDPGCPFHGEQAYGVEQ